MEMSCFNFLKKKNSYEFQHPYFEKESGAIYRTSKVDLNKNNQQNLKANKCVVISK